MKMKNRSLAGLLGTFVLFFSSGAMAFSDQYDYTSTVGFSCRLWADERLYMVIKPGSTYRVSKEVTSAAKRGHLLYEIHGKVSVKEPKQEEKNLDFVCFIQYIESTHSYNGDTRLASIEYSDADLNRRLWRRFPTLEPVKKAYRLNPDIDPNAPTKAKGK